MSADGTLILPVETIDEPAPEPAGAGRPMLHTVPMDEALAEALAESEQDGPTHPYARADDPSSSQSLVPLELVIDDSIDLPVRQVRPAVAALLAAALTAAVFWVAMDRPQPAQAQAGVPLPFAVVVGCDDDSAALGSAAGQGRTIGDHSATTGSSDSSLSSAEDNPPSATAAARSAVAPKKATTRRPRAQRKRRANPRTRTRPKRRAKARRGKAHRPAPHTRPRSKSKRSSRSRSGTRAPSKRSGLSAQAQRSHASARSRRHGRTRRRSRSTSKHR